MYSKIIADWANEQKIVKCGCCETRISTTEDDKMYSFHCERYA